MKPQATPEPWYHDRKIDRVSVDQGQRLVDPLIRFDRVAVSLSGRTILNHLSFELHQGEKAVIRGPSGAGKSTVLKTLLGLYPLASGSILFEGRRLGPETLQDIRRRTAYIGQEPVLGADRVREALLLPFTFKANRALRPTEGDVENALARVGLPLSLLLQDCATVSGGEKQRLAIARATLLQKRLYLLDEVTSNLDPVSKLAVLGFFADPSFTVLSVAHDPDWIAWCGTVFDLNHGMLTRLA